MLHARKKHLKQAASALPWLRSLDVSLEESLHDLEAWTDAFSSCSQLTNLESLGVHLKYDNERQSFSAFPEIASLVARGVQLRFITNEEQKVSVFGCSY